MKKPWRDFSDENKWGIISLVVLLTFNHSYNKMSRISELAYSRINGYFPRGGSASSSVHNISDDLGVTIVNPDATGYYSTIQEAVDAAEVGMGFNDRKTILITPGTYTGDVVISRRLSLIGSGTRYRNHNNDTIIVGKLTISAAVMAENLMFRGYNPRPAIELGVFNSGDTGGPAPRTITFNNCSIAGDDFTGSTGAVELVNQSTGAVRFECLDCYIGNSSITRSVRISNSNQFVSWRTQIVGQIYNDGTGSIQLIQSSNAIGGTKTAIEMTGAGFATPTFILTVNNAINMSSSTNGNTIKNSVPNSIVDLVGSLFSKAGGGALATAAHILFTPESTGSYLLLDNNVFSRAVNTVTGALNDNIVIQGTGTATIQYGSTGTVTVVP
jgi:hypothetical protein